MTRLRLLAVIAVALGGPGCGLISSDVTNFDLSLPDKIFTVDAESWDLSQEEADSVLSTSCAGNEGLCATLADAACENNCEAACNATTETCDLTLAVAVYQGVDLLAEQPELKAIDDEPVIDVSITSVTWEVLANTLNVETPPLTVYVAPATVLDPTDPQATAIGTIDSVAPATTTSAPVPLAFTPNGRATLIQTMRTFRTPFNIIVGASQTIAAGQDVPSGQLDAVVHITGTAGF